MAEQADYVLVLTTGQLASLRILVHDEREHAEEAGDDFQVAVLDGISEYLEAALSIDELTAPPCARLRDWLEYLKVR